MDLSTYDPLPKYNPLKDKYLESYFQSPTVQRHLREVGLMSKDGTIVSDEEYKRATIRRQQRWAARQLMSQRAVLQSRDFQLGRQLELRKQLDAVQKIETYRKVKGGETFTHELVHVEPLDLEKSLTRSQSAPGLSRFRNMSAPVSTRSPEQVLQSSGYQTDDERPRSLPQTQESLNSSRARSLRRRYLSDNYRFQYLHKLDSSSLEDYEGHLRQQLMRIEKFRRQMQTYYNFEDGLTPPGTGLPGLPRMPLDSAASSYRGRSLSIGSTPKWNHLRFQRSQIKRTRSVSPEEGSKQIKKNVFVTSAAARKRRQLQPSCECFLQYLGPTLEQSETGETGSNQTEICIMQQTSSGNNLSVFKETLSPKAKFQFVSYRQKGYPFSLEIMDQGSNVGDRVIAKVSICCESKFEVLHKLGGPNGSFKWMGVKNATPCYRCQASKGIKPPFTNFGQKKKKLKRVKKQLSEGNEQIAAAENVDAAANSDADMSQDDKPISGKPPRPKSASIGSRRNSRNSTAMAAVAGGGLIVAGASTLAAIEDQDEDGAHSKVPSEHGSSLQVSSEDEQHSDKEAKSKSAKSSASRKMEGDEAENLHASDDDFFDVEKTETEDKEEETNNASRNEENEEETKSVSGSGSRSSSGSSGESESEKEEAEAEAEEAKVEAEAEDEEVKSQNQAPHGKWSLEHEHSLEHKEISVVQENTDNNTTGQDESKSESESESEDKTEHIDEPEVNTENDNEGEKTENAGSEGEAESRTSSRATSSKSVAQKSRTSTARSKTEDTKSRRSSHASAKQSKRSSIASGWNKSDDENEEKQDQDEDVPNDNVPAEVVPNGIEEDANKKEIAEAAGTELAPQDPVPKEEEQKEEKEKTVETVSDSDSSSSLSDSDEDETISKSVNDKGEDANALAEKLQQAGNALISDDTLQQKLNRRRSTVVLVDVHKSTSNADAQPWICGECNFDNDGDENDCRICGANKSSALTTDNNQEVKSIKEDQIEENEAGPSENVVAEEKINETNKEDNEDENKVANEGDDISEDEEKTIREENDNASRQVSMMNVAEEKISITNEENKQILLIEEKNQEAKQENELKGENDTKSEGEPDITENKEDNEGDSDNESNKEEDANDENADNKTIPYNFDDTNSIKEINQEGDNRNENETNVENESGDKENVDLRGEAENQELAAEEENIANVEEGDRTWTCKFCSTKNEGDAPNCMGCLLAKRYSEPSKKDSSSSSFSIKEPGNELDTNKSVKSLKISTADQKSVSDVGSRPEVNVDENQRDNADSQSRQSQADDESQLHLMQPAIEVQPPTPSVVSNRESDEADDLQQQSTSSSNQNIEDPSNATLNPTSEDDGTRRPEIEGVDEEVLDELTKVDPVLTNLELNDEQFGKVADVLASNNNLNSVTIKKSQLTDQSLEIVANALFSSEAPLQTVNLNTNTLTENAVPSILKLVENKPVEILSVNDNRLSDDGLKSLLDTLLGLMQQGQMKLRRLDISENGMGDQTAKSLGQFISYNDQLQSLSIGGSNEISEEGWRSIADGLSSNDSLQALCLDYCHLGDSNIELLCQSLKNKTQLKALDIDGNDITEKGGAFIVELVRSCPNIKSVVCVAGNSVSIETMNRVQQIISGRQYPEEKDHLSLSAKHFVK